MIDWWGPIIDEYYSSTEGNPFTYITAPEWLAHRGSVGRPFLGTPHVCDEAGHDLPPGEIGLIYSHRPDSAFEYPGDPGKTQETRHPEHADWTTLGDMGYLDADGYLYLTDRKNFMIISGGVHVYPAEIESCLVLHPAVADVAVFGVPDLEMGEIVQAVVQPAPGVAGTPELAASLMAFDREHIAGYKVPKRTDFRGSLPRMPTGKLAKGPLRAARRSGSCSTATPGAWTGRTPPFDEDNRARAEVYFLAFHPHADNGHPEMGVISGRYLVKLERSDGRWGIVRRVVISDWTRNHFGGAQWERTTGRSGYVGGRRGDTEASYEFFGL